MKRTTMNGSAFTGEEVADFLAEFASAHPKGTPRANEFVAHLTQVTHRTMQQRVMGLLVALVEAWAEGKGGQDGRNEATIKLCKKIVEATGDQYDRVLPYA